MRHLLYINDWDKDEGCLRNTTSLAQKPPGKLHAGSNKQPGVLNYARGDPLLTQHPTTRPGADCGSHDELLIVKFRLKLKKVGKTTRPFRYDLNQIPYDYTEEVTNRFSGVDLIDRVPEELWTGASDQDHPQEKEMQKGKMIVWGGLSNS